MSKYLGVLSVVFSVVAATMAFVALQNSMPGNSRRMPDQTSASAIQEPDADSEAVPQNAGTLATDVGDNDSPESASPTRTATKPRSENARRPKGSSANILLPRTEAPASKEQLETEATFVAEQLVELLPNQAISLHVLAMLKAQLHQTADAEELWERCVELDPKAEPYVVNLAAILLDRGEADRAVEILELARQQGSDSLDVNHHLAIALNSVGRAEEAIDIAEKGLDSSPNSGSLRLILGQAQLQAGQVEAAENNLRRAVDLGVNSKSGYFALFNACMRNGKRDEAAKFRELYASFEEQELDAEERYQILSEAEARRICVSILSESATVYRAIPDLETSEHLLLRVLALDPGNRAACLDLAAIYAARGQKDNQILILKRTVELDPFNLLNYLKLAKALVSAERVAEAEAQIKLAISYAPQTVTGYAAMTDFLMEQQRPADAQWYVEQAIRLKTSPQGFTLLARTLEAQGKSQEAESARQVAKQLATESAVETGKEQKDSP